MTRRQKFHGEKVFCKSKCLEIVCHSIQAGTGYLNSQYHYRTQLILHSIAIRFDIANLTDLIDSAQSEIISTLSKPQKSQTSVVDPKTLKLDPDPEFWTNSDPDPGLCNQIIKNKKIKYFR